MKSFLSVLLLSALVAGQAPDVKFIADTLVVQADGTYEADPDLATITFRIFSQEKDIKQAYAVANQSIQRITLLASNNGLKKDDVSTGVLTLSPVYEGDRKKRARSYYVQSQITLKVHDFTHIGPILDNSVEDGVADFRSITYSLSDEEAAKKQAVAEAMRHAIGRGAIALEQKGEKLGALRYLNIDVKQLYGVTSFQNVEASTAETVSRDKAGLAPPPPPPPPQPEKIKLTASVECAFKIE